MTTPVSVQDKVQVGESAGGQKGEKFFEFSSKKCGFYDNDVLDILS